MNKKTIIIALLALVSLAAKAQKQVSNGVYKLSEIIHQDGKHLEAQFKQYKFCLDKYSLTVGFNSVIFSSDPVAFGISNPDGKTVAVYRRTVKDRKQGHTTVQHH